jgi:hypothetical protein
LKIQKGGQPVKVWYVEDAGGGCRAFSEVLVLVCEEPEEIYTSQMPLTWESDLTWEQMATQLVVKMMETAKVTKDDQLYVCSGNIFHDFHRYLTEAGYTWEYHKMDGLAHQVAEQAFYQQILNAGFPSFVRPSDDNYRLFYAFVEKWLAQDPSRNRYLKDRPKRTKPIEQFYTLKSNNRRSRFCHQCKQPIRPFDPMVDYQFKQNGRRVSWHYHPDCSPVTPGKNKLKTGILIIDGQEITGVIRVAKENNPVCSFCQQNVEPGEEVFSGYLQEKLVQGHLTCGQSLKTSLAQ